MIKSVGGFTCLHSCMATVHVPHARARVFGLVAPIYSSYIKFQTQFMRRFLFPKGETGGTTSGTDWESFIFYTI